MGYPTISPTTAMTIIAVKTGILIPGGLTTHFSYKAYRNMGAASLRVFVPGFGIITLGAILGNAFDTILNVNLATGLLIDLALTFISFAVIACSPYIDWVGPKGGF